MTLGGHGQLTAAEARREAKKAAGEVAKGRDPQELRKAPREAPTVRDLAARFMAEHAAKRSASTRRNYGILWERHLLPALGSKTVAEVGWADVARLHYKMRATPYMGNRMLSLVSKAWSLAAKWGWWPREIPNPGREHDRHREDQERGSALSEEQLQAVGGALAKEEGSPADALRLCILSGARPSEVRLLRWEDLEPDGRVVRLPDSKTGSRCLYLGGPAAEIVARQPRLGAYVFPGGDPRKANGRGRFDPDSPQADLKGVWSRVRERAGLDGRVRMYDATRHTFATWAEELGVPRERLRRLVGHSVRDITSRYTHQRREVLLADADLVAHAVFSMMDAQEPGRQFRTGG